MWPARLALLSAVAIAGCYQHPDFKSVEVSGSDWGRSIALTGHDGRARSLADFKGKIVVLIFGHTSCGNACAALLSGAASALQTPKGRADQVQVLFVTLDPARDSAKVLGKYVTAFHPSFLGLFGDAAATERTAREFKVAPEKHAAQAFVFDPSGRLRLLVKADRIAADLPHDVGELLHEAARHGQGKR